MKNQVEIRQSFVELLGKNEKEHSQNQNLSFELVKLKSETTDSANLQNNLSECRQKCATQEDKLKEAKCKLRNR